MRQFFAILLLAFTLSFFMAAPTAEAKVVKIHKVHKKHHKHRHHHHHHRHHKKVIIS